MAVPLPATSPPEGECRALAARILASRPFQRTARLRDFLSYIVDRKFAGTPDEMTEAVIGNRVFHRPASYNPGEDSIVRTEARILRQRLDQYFAGEGAGESILLEIPKGAYIPVFVRRPPPAAPARKGWAWLWPAAALMLAILAFFAYTQLRSRQPEPVRGDSKADAFPAGAVRLSSSDRVLAARFEEARRQALRYVYSGDTVGRWYDGNWYQDRYAFYMRDAAHQSTGAAVLGLTAETRNMLHLFAAAVSDKRRWCGFWGINKDGFPTPVDYRSDKDFYYCLPANFDVMRASYEQFLWTGDESYFDAAFSSFYDRTVADYVSAWDRDGDGLIESHLEPGQMGRGSYYQFNPKPLVGADMLAAQYRGYVVYASLQERKGARGSLSRRIAEQFRAKAEALRVRYNTDWWDAERKQYYSMMLADKSYYSGYIPESVIFPVLFGVAEDGPRTDKALDAMVAKRAEVEAQISYFPEVLFHSGRDDLGYRFLLEISGPGFAAHSKPEIAFATVGTTVTGLMGIAADAPGQTVETGPHLPRSLDWVKVEHLPVLRNQVAILHRGVSETVITNQAGPLFQWKACFPVESGEAADNIAIDGTAVPAAMERHGSRKVVWVRVPVKPGQTRTARYSANF